MALAQEAGSDQALAEAAAEAGLDQGEGLVLAQEAAEAGLDRAEGLALEAVGLALA